MSWMYFVTAAVQMMIALVVLAIGPLIVWRVGAWIARPLDLAARNRRHPTQFTIVDFLCLFVLVQLPTALIHSIEPTLGIQTEALYILDGYAWFSIGLIWWKSVQIMSRAGIQQPRHRVILLLFVLPVTLVGPLLPIVFTIVTAIGMAKFPTVGGLVLTALFIAVSVPACMFLSARLVRRIVAASDAVAEVPVEVVEEDSP